MGILGIQGGKILVVGGVIVVQDDPCACCCSCITFAYSSPSPMLVANYYLPRIIATVDGACVSNPSATTTRILVTNSNFPAVGSTILDYSAVNSLVSDSSSDGSYPHILNLGCGDELYFPWTVTVQGIVGGIVETECAETLQSTDLIDGGDGAATGDPELLMTLSWTGTGEFRRLQNQQYANGQTRTIKPSTWTSALPTFQDWRWDLDSIFYRVQEFGGPTYTGSYDVGTACHTNSTDSFDNGSGSSAFVDRSDNWDDSAYGGVGSVITLATVRTGAGWP